MATTLMSLVATLSLDKQGFDTGIKESQSTFSKLGGSAKKLMSVTAKAAGAALAVSAAAVGKIVKDAVNAYKDYEQLVGGVETLFGAGGKSLEKYAESVGLSVDKAAENYNKLMEAQDKVFTDSKTAFRDAGMSANEYMETATSFSASLIQSLGGDTVKAADMTKQAIIDMSDNANKMGTDIESIKTAYAGFAKQNYTMLDNLKLGYGGTKSEMERLIKDANKLRKAQGINSKLTINSYADVIEAIHTVQEEMGITGTTADEAERTIQGSLSMTQAAWQNLLVAIAGGNISMKTAIGDFVTSAKNVVKNIMPVISTALSGIGELIKEIVPIITRELPGLISALLPKLLEAAASLVTGLVQALPGILRGVIESVKVLFNTIVSTFSGVDWAQLGQDILAKISTAFNNVGAWLGNIWAKVKDFISSVNWVELYDTAQRGMLGIVDWVIAWVVNTASVVIAEIQSIDWAAVGKTVLDMLYTGIKNIAGWFRDKFNEAAEAIGEVEWEDLGESIVGFITDAFKGIADWFKKLFGIGVDGEPGVKDSIENGVDWKGLGLAILNYIKSVFTGLWKFFKGVFQAVWAAIKNLVDWKQLGKDIWDWIVDKFNDVAGWFEDKFEEAKEAIKNLPWVQTGVAIWNWISGAFSSIRTWFTNKFNTAAEAIKGVNWKQVGTAIWNWIGNAFSGIKEWFTNKFNTAITAIKSVNWTQAGTAAWNWITNAFSSVKDWFKKRFGGAIEAIKGQNWTQAGSAAWNWITGAFSNVKGWFSTRFSGAIDGIKGLVDSFKSIGSSIWGWIVEKIPNIPNWFSQKFRLAINTIIGWLNTGIGKVNGFMKSVVDKMNTLNFSMGGKTYDWGILGKITIPKVTFGISGVKAPVIPSLKYLARGGFLGEGESAVVGEKRPEMLTVVGGKAFVQPIGGINPGDRLGGDTFNTTLNIYQQPGEDTETLTDRIEDALTRVINRRRAAFA